jgi:hypothetical protein
LTINFNLFSLHDMLYIITIFIQFILAKSVSSYAGSSEIISASSSP